MESTWIRLILAMIMAYAFSAGIVIGGLAMLTRPCPTEDSQSCTWYAQTQGSNPGGQSFTDIGGVVVIRWG
jgi:hypothetical protein